MLRRIVFAAAPAGLIAGLVLTAAQSWQVLPLIFEAETLEAAQAPATEGANDAAGSHPSTIPWAGISSRLALAFATNAATGIGYGLILTALFALRGGVRWREGALWGGAGFLAFGLAPALGLPPELPGAAVADLASRQTWWVLAAGCTTSSLALFAFARQPILRVAGLAVLVVPHAISAPHTPGEDGPAPAELAARFTVASLFAAAVF